MLPILLLQAATGPVLPLTSPPRVAAPCPLADGDDIVVCARPQESYRLRPLPPRPEAPALPKAQVRVGNAALAAEAEQATLAGGQQSQRLMVRLKLPFGHPKR